MKLVIQRVKSASVSLMVKSTIQSARFAAFLVGPEDDQKDLEVCGPKGIADAHYFSQMRKIRWIFRSKDIQGSILSFTLFAEQKATVLLLWGLPSQLAASQLYDTCDQLEKKSPSNEVLWASGEPDWSADGPVTILLEYKNHK